MPAAGSTAIGSWRLRPIFCRPWNKPFHHCLRGTAAALLALIATSLDGPVLAVATLAAHWCRPVAGQAAADGHHSADSRLVLA
jgi:hypothetical protein